MKNSVFTHTHTHTTFLFLTFILANLLVLTQVTAQGDFKIPVVLTHREIPSNRPVTANEIYSNYDALMQNPDTTLGHAKKVAQRWMAHSLPYLNVDANGFLTNKPIYDAFQAIYTSPLQCEGNDLANWESDGPAYMPDWILNYDRQQQSNGWVDAVYNNALDTNIYVLGTRTSGFMRTTDGGTKWTSVTDALDFPVLGVRQFLVDPDDPEYIMAITGTDIIEGSLIYSNDAGLTWTQNQQNLPQFYSMCYHPTIDNLIFAASRKDVFISYDNGVSFNSLNAPDMDTEFQTEHWDFYQIMVLDDKFYGIAAHNNSQEFYMVKCDISNIDVQNESITTNWAFGVEADFIDSNKVLVGAQFSNIALGRFYLFVKQANNKKGNTGLSRFVYKSFDYGDTYSVLPNTISISGDINNGKCELIASAIDPNILYNGVVSHVKRWNDTTGVDRVIEGAPDSLNGHHDDYRSSHLLTINGKERIVFGNDGGIAIVRDGLETTPLIYTLNGDLSINLLHAFDIHEETGRTLFAFQDHKMVYRDRGNIYSSRFLHEGAFAMIQQQYPDAMVGASGTTIKDDPGSTHPIVSPNLSEYPFPGYHQHYRHYPERFIAGLKHAKIGINRAANVSEYSEIPFFIDYPGTDSLKTHEIGDVAICQRKPEFIYVARNGMEGSEKELLVKSINDADPNSWISLSANLILFPDGTTSQLNHKAHWRGIRSLAVDHFDENLVYCGMEKVHTSSSGTPLDEEFRVIKSTTGGEPNPNLPDSAAWIDYSEGLPAFPVERLLTVESDNELIFCATSVGIYYRTKTMDQWECFSKGLPYTEITGLKYDYCNNMLYASTYGRGLWKTEVNIPIVNTYSEIIDEDQTWDEDKTIYAPITVEAGNTLTITAVIRMATGTNIIIEPGAALILDGGTLTNACGGVWKGIKVMGNRYLPQQSSTHGRLILKNQAVIENAANAVTLWKADDWTTTGGIIQATNSTFRNNKRSVEFLSYQNKQSNDSILPNKSFFKNCTFEINDDYLIPEEGNKQMITMYHVDGVRIMGCDFKYTRNVPSYNELKAAIYTIDANFRVGNSCSAMAIPVGEPCPEEYTRQSTFTGFNKAVHATGAGMNVGPQIKGAKFSKNMVGITFDAVTAPAAIFNEFTVGNNAFDVPDDPNFHLGIKVNNCDEYIVEENEFIGNDSHGWATHGVFTFAESNYSNSNEIFNNTYSDLTSASIVEGIHAETPVNNESYIGLRFVCNKNEKNINDFEVRAFNGVDFSRISSYQNGGANLPAGNTFSVGNTGDNIYTHFDFFSNIKYQYVKKTSDTDPKESEIYITPPGGIAIASLNTQNNCPTNYPGPGGGLSTEVTYGKFKGQRVEYGNLRYTYLQLLDQGNTEGMIAEIDLSWPKDAWDLHNELMHRSPYNSETVLIAAADKNILTHGMLLEILLANPDALRSGEVINHVQYKLNSPLPQYMVDILQNAARDPGTVRSIMEKNLSDLHLEMVRTHKRITHKQLNDTIVGFHPDTLLQYFSSIRSLAGRYQQIFAYTGLNQYANAIAVTDSITNHYRLENEQYAELNNTKDFIYFLEALHNDGRNIAQLGSSEIATLTQISNKEPGGQAASRAENILCFFYDLCKKEMGSPKSNSVKTNKPKPTDKELYEGLNTVKVAPNPANTYIEFEYAILIPSEKSVLRILDVQGRPIKSWNLGTDQRGLKVLDTREFINGVYFYELFQGNEKLKGGKFIIQH